jgi:hypothetical protein
MLAEPLQITRIVTRTFESLGIRYFIGGSLASSLHGIPRATQDVDLVAEVDHSHVDALARAFESAFYVDAESIHRAITDRRSFNLIHLETMFKIDVFILKRDSVSREQMSRRQSYQLSDDSADVLFLSSAEDTIISKLVWYELGGNVSDRQWSDVLGVLQVQGQNLDQAYLRGAAEQRDILPLLEQAIRDAREEDV